MHDAIAKLNPEQQAAVYTTDGPLLVLAGAGSGKTRVITFRIAYLLEIGIPPSQILGLTFTNKAAGEMKERVHALTQSDVLICTFHGLGARILRESIHHLGYQRSFTIYDEDDVDRLLKGCMESIAKVDLKTLRTAISRAKNSFISPDEEARLPYIPELGPLFARLYRAYQDKLKECNAVDYDDLLFLPAKLFNEHPEVLEFYQQRWSHLLIDEYQDTNTLQYTIVNKLVEKHQNLCVVGDPDQSIYSWRGADIENIINFERDYANAKVIRLDQNYRSQSNILDAANAVISRNSRRYEKKLWSALGPGEKIKLLRCDDETAEARFIAETISKTHHEKQIPLTEIVVFYRTNAQSRVFEDKFLERRIPYVIVGGISFYQRREIKDILAWLRIIHSGADLISFERTINLPKRGFGDSTLEKIRYGSTQESRTIIGFCEMLSQNEPVQTTIKLNAKQKENLKEYVHLIHLLRDYSQNSSLTDLIIAIIDRTRYREHLEADPETLQERVENLDALIAKAAEWDEKATQDVLGNFLEELSLKSSLDEASEGEVEKVSLMTIHNGKGLEFALTFLAGLEEDLFPHVNTKSDDKAVEEERRLCYVGMTRAKQLLYLTYVVTRFMWGVRRSQRPSRFLNEIPSEFVEKIGRPGGSAYSPSPSRYEQSKPATPVKQGGYVTPKPPMPHETMNIGEMVFHPEFGIGQVRDVSQGAAGLTYRIFFQKERSEKSLVAQFAHLTKL